MSAKIFLRVSAGGYSLNRVQRDECGATVFPVDIQLRACRYQQSRRAHRTFHPLGKANFRVMPALRLDRQSVAPCDCNGSELTKCLWGFIPLGVAGASRARDTYAHTNTWPPSSPRPMRVGLAHEVSILTSFAGCDRQYHRDILRIRAHRFRTEPSDLR